jgi:hypothetical protein
MAKPFPPQGQQTQHNERPLKVYAEQSVLGAPLPIGAVVMPELGDDLPRVITDTKAYVLHDTEWVISNRYTGRPIEVISDDEFTERFGG